MKEQPKMYVIRKYIKAPSALSAIRKDKTTPVHDCWIDNDWREKELADAIGFAEIEDDLSEYEEE